MERNALAQVLPDRGRGGELRKWTPGIMDNMRWYASKALAPLFGGDVRAANAYYRDKIQPTAEYLPGVGDLMAAGEARDAFSGGDYLGGTLLAAGAAAGLVPGVGDAVQKGTKHAVKGIRAYHGSPHDFDKFDMGKIGTGEGAQAYGHGLYFAENEGIAKSYRDALSGGVPNVAYKGEPLPVWTGSGNIDGIDPEKYYASMFGTQSDPKFARDAHIDYLQSRKTQILKKDDIPPSVQQRMISSIDEEIADIKKFDPDQIEKLQQGRMYEVNINANPDDFLDWDKPLSEQPRILEQFGYNEAKHPDDWIPDVNMTGAELYRRYAGQTNSGVRGDANVAAYNQLASGAPRPIRAKDGSIIDRPLRIPGIKYLDAGSRSAGDGSRNYVVFDDSLIEILRKYGVLPATIGTGAFMQMMQDDPQKAEELHNFATSMRDGA